MKSIGDIGWEKPKQKSFKSRRDELNHRLHDGIWAEAKRTGYNLDEKWDVGEIAKRAYRCPGLKNDDEFELLIKTCEERGDYKKFWWVTK